MPGRSVCYKDKTEQHLGCQAQGAPQRPVLWFSRGWQQSPKRGFILKEEENSIYLKQYHPGRKQRDPWYDHGMISGSEIKTTPSRLRFPEFSLV